jgi:RNA polymerase sigma factor (sigma-70 family)
MTDSQLLLGITQNDERAWRFICKNMKFGFDSIIKQASSSANLSQEDVDDIFQESCVVLMHNAKGGKIAVTREGAIFSYLVEVGKLKTRNLLRKRRCITSDDMVTFSLSQHNNEESDMTIDEKQQMQNDFLDKVLDLLPSECRTLLKHFYWDHKPMDEIASILGMRNADSAKSKKSKCMNKIKDIATQLIESEEFAEEAIRNAVERAVLRELLAEEMAYADSGFCMAALDVDDKNKDK